MPWPTPQDYNEAIQNPATCFADEGLRRGEVESNALGLPRSITGAFASVYRVTENNRSWAVRCFLKFRPDQQERYEKVSQYVMFDELEYTVHFEYLSKGIRVRGEWFPMLKMEWVEGETLDQYLESNVRNRSQVKSLLGKFDQMMAELRAAGIAHGDLQHGNIMVVNGDLRLVDYDGMYVPKLAGWRSLELGHSNYQHPLRSDTDFDPTLDNFSAHVIRTSLLTLIDDQSLWSDSHVGDECLLFKKRDFIQPDSSELFNHLLAHKSKDVQVSAASLAHLCKCRPSDVPFIGATREEILDIPIYVPGEHDKENNSATLEREIYQKTRYDDNVTGAGGTGKASARPKTNRFKSGVFSAASEKLKDAANQAWDYVVPKLSPRFAAERAIADGDNELEHSEFSKAIASYTRALQIIENAKGTTMDTALQTFILAKIATACMLDHRPALVTYHLKEALKNNCDPESPYFEKALAHVAITCFEKGMIKEARGVMWTNFRDKMKLLEFPSLLKGSYYENRVSVAKLLTVLSEVYADAVDDQHLALACCEVALAHYELSDYHAVGEYEAIAQVRLRRIHCHLSIEQVSSADHQCERLWRDKQLLSSDTRARVVFLQAFFDSLSGDFDKAFTTLSENITQLTVLEKSLKSEMRSAMKTYFSVAEFLREMGSRYAARDMHAEAKLFYGSAAWMYHDFRKTPPREHALPEGRNTRASKKASKTGFAGTYQLKYVECLIGQYELVEAARLLKKITAAEHKDIVRKLERSLALAFEAVGDFNSALALIEIQHGADGEDVKRIKASARDAQLKKAQQLESNGKYKDAKRIYESLDGNYKSEIERLKGQIRTNDLNTAQRLVSEGAFEDALNMYLRLESTTSELVVSTRYKLINELLILGKGHGDIISDYGKLRIALDHIEELAKSNSLSPELITELTNLVCSWGTVRGRSFRRWIESLSDCISTVEGAASDCVKRLQAYEKSLADKRAVAEPQKQSKNPFAAAAVLLGDSHTSQLNSDSDSSDATSPSPESNDLDDDSTSDTTSGRQKSVKRSALAESLIGQGLFQIHNRRIAAAQDSFTKAKKHCDPSTHAHTKAVLGLALSLFLTEDNPGALEQIDSLSEHLDHVVGAMQEIAQGFTVKVENAADFAYLAASRLEEVTKDADTQIAKLYRQAYDLFKRTNKSKPVQQLDCFAGFARIEEIEKELEKYRTSQAIAEKPFKTVQIKIAKRWVRQGKFNAAKELFELLDGPKSKDLQWCLEEQTMSQIEKACKSERKGDGPLREAFHVLTELHQRKLLTAEFCLKVGKHLRENLPHSSVLSGLGKELRRISELFVAVEGADGPAAGMLLSRIKGTGY